MSGYVAELRGAIEEFTPLLEKMSDEARRRRSPVTLDHFVADYVAHLKHPLKQIIAPD